MPLARAVQCLESKEVNAADVYLYWLAVVAQYNDLISRDDTSVHSKYTSKIKETIRAILNYRFSQLIENAGALNVYLVAFALDPCKCTHSVILLYL